MSKYHLRYSNLINPVLKDTDIGELQELHYDYVQRYRNYSPDGKYKNCSDHRLLRYGFMVNIVYIENLIHNLDSWVFDNCIVYEP